ncbi:MAG: ATPase [Planctomycetes bacterium]|nr:ATPase [Planctomycetota bacterium]
MSWVKRCLTRPAGLLTSTFALLIVIGWVLLSLPIAHARAPVSVLDAFFTATSAVCVTGLVVVDTGADFSPFGQVVILALIQLGGLGIMTFAAIALQVFGRSISFRHSASLHDVFYQTESVASLRSDLKWIVGLTLVCEAVGAALLCPGLRAAPEGRLPAFSAVFHAVSAFCNAGFSLHEDSLTAYRGSPLVMPVIMTLIVVGGLGHTTLIELLRRARRRVLEHSAAHRAWSVNTKAVLWTSAALLGSGFVLLLLTGVGGSGADLGSRLLDALFQSVTARTAGFNTVNIAALPIASQLILITLMFIGGSPGSCAGGVKTTTFALALAYLRARLFGRPDVTLFRRRVAQRNIARMVALIALALVWNAFGCALLAATELGGETRFALNDILVEQISAFATVGLSTGITPELSFAGKLWITLTMFVGRLGPLTVALVVVAPVSRATRYPEAHVMVG